MFLVSWFDIVDRSTETKIVSPCLYLMQNGPTDHVGSCIQAFARNQVSEENNSQTLSIFNKNEINGVVILISR